MEHNKDFIDVNYIDIENTVFLTAPQIAKEIGDDEKRVRYWGDVYGDLCGVIKIDGRKKYTKATISAFKFVRELVDDKKFSRLQVREHIEKHGFEYANYGSGLINPSDPLGFQALASALTIEMNKRLDEFLENVSSQLQESNKELVDSMQEQIAITVDEVISDKMEEYFNKVDNRELAKTNEMNEKLDNIRLMMGERKKESENEEKKSWFKKIFG